MKRTRKNAFTLIELLVVISIIALLIGILLPALGKAKQRANSLKDSTQVRSIIQGLVVFAGNNKENYPLPSRIDKNNKTLLAPTGSSQEKNTTGNIFSILISQGLIETGICYSPIEQGNYEEYAEYENDAPVGAVSVGTDASQAIWDPNFKATPIDVGASNGALNEAADSVDIEGWDTLPGGFSYAHTAPFAFRRSQWINTFAALEPVLSNRGPVYQLDGSGETGTWELYEDAGFGGTVGEAPLGINSVTLAINGNSTSWSGNVGFNDTHVEVFSDPDPSKIVWTYTGLGQNENRTQPDNIFMNEGDSDREEAGDAHDGGTTLLNGEEANRNAFMVQYSKVVATADEISIQRHYD